MLKAVILAAVVVLLIAPAIAQSGEESSAVGPRPKTEDFVKEAAGTNTFEIASGKLATQRGGDNVKPFAEKMISDHINDLRELVSSGKVQAGLPTEMTMHQDTQMRRLESL
jgi:putative membrane protein